MQTVNLSQIKDAQAKISSIVKPSPVLPSVYLSQASGFDVILKLENLNVSGSFKIRGAANALLNENSAHLQRGVVAASAGNHAQGVAHVCKLLQSKATIFMPERTPLVKVESTRMLGADVILTGQSFDDAFKTAQSHASTHRSVFVHPYADTRVICGQGTIGLELLEQVQDFDAVIVPIGGGGLIGGVACAIKSQHPNIKVIGVQSEYFPAMKQAFEGKPVSYAKNVVTIADGIAVKTVEQLNVDLLKRYVDDVIVVEEEEISSSVMDLVEKNHLLAEGAGAASVAGLLKIKDQLNVQGVKRVVCIISGGNIDINLLSRISTRGLIHSGRLSRFKFTIKDKPGALASLLQIISATGANLNEVYHDRTFATAHYSDVEVEAVVETSNHMHRSELIAALKKAGIEFITLS